MYRGTIMKELDPSKTTRDQALLYAIGESGERRNETDS
jgi:hypothetical protein